MTARPGPRTSRPRWLANYGRERGTTYLIHIDPPYQHAHHYTGWTDKPLPERFADHLAGRGALLTRVAVRAGCTLTLARVWPETTKDREDSLKHRGGARRFCPECGVKPAASRLPSDTAPQRLSLYELERLGTTSDGTPLPVITTCPDPAPPGPDLTHQEEDMFGRERRATARAHQREREAAAAEADRLLAEADRLDELTQRPSYRREITAERAARIRERIGADVAADARGQVAEPRLDGAGLDAEIGRLAQQYPEPDAGLSVWDRYVMSQPGSHEHKAAYVDMHREAGGEGFADPNPDRGYLIEHGYQTDADRWAMPGDYSGSPAGSAEADWPGPEPGPDAARWSPEAQDAGLEAAADPVARAEEQLAREVSRHGQAVRNSRVHAAAAVLADNAAGRQQAQLQVRRDQHQQSMADTWAWGAATRLQQAGLEADNAPGRVPPEPLPRILAPGQSAAPAPDPTHLPDGLPHPNQFLAEHGWATQGGWHVRQAEHQLEAG